MLSLLLALVLQVPDTTCLRLARASTDSVAKLHLASTTLTQYQVRSLRRLDSLHTARCATAAPPPTPPDTGVARVEIALRATTTVLWPMGHVGALPTADALLCALVETDGQQYLGTPAVLATIVARDSIAWREAAVSRNADALRRECARDLPTWPVTWASVRVTFAAVPAAIPVASAVIP